MIFILGGCHVDVIAKVRDHFAPGTSCPGYVETKYGGVARNVACLLSASGCEVFFYGRIGADEAGGAIRRDLVARGIDVSGLAVDPEISTGRYVAIHDEAGSMVAAVSDLAIYDRVSANDLPRSFEGFKLVFADCNVPADVLDRLAASCPDRLAVDAISAAKVSRLAVALRRGALVSMNLATASALLDQRVADAPAAAAALVDIGGRRAVVTDGGRPLAILDQEKVMEPIAMEDETGAGDALMAGVLVGLNAGWPLEAAVRLGVRVAAAALQTRGALAAIPAGLLKESGLQVAARL
jgi:pseudouridine kinase